jgi:cell division transport system permease protein
MFTLLKRIFKFGWLNFFREGGGLAVATIFILTMAVCAISSMFFLKDISEALIARIQDKVDVSVYFKFDVPENDILKVKDEVLVISEVKDVEYVSKEQALNDFKEKHKDSPILMSSLDEVGVNPFLASLNIRAFEASQYQAVANFFDDGKFDDLVEKVDYYQRKPIIERLDALSTNLKRAGVVFSVVLAIIAILVAFNAVRLAIYSSREEIKIQRLVGASNWFIRGPFLVQGAISGLTATLISFLLFFLTCWLASSKMEFLFSGFDLFGFFLGSVWIILLIQFISGIGLGIASSFIAVRRYLKV